MKHEFAYGSSIASPLSDDIRADARQNSPEPIDLKNAAASAAPWLLPILGLGVLSWWIVFLWIASFF